MSIGKHLVGRGWDARESPEDYYASSWQVYKVRVKETLKDLEKIKKENFISKEDYRLLKSKIKYYFNERNFKRFEKTHVTSFYLELVNDISEMIKDGMSKYHFLMRLEDTEFIRRFVRDDIYHYMSTRDLIDLFDERDTTKENFSKRYVYQIKFRLFSKNLNEIISTSIISDKNFKDFKDPVLKKMIKSKLDDYKKFNLGWTNEADLEERLKYRVLNIKKIVY